MSKKTPKPQTAEQVNAPQIGSLTVATTEGETQAIRDGVRHIISNAAPAPLCESPNIEGPAPEYFFRILTQLLKELRRVRDSKSFTAEGCHTFREWCMKQFGERLGGWIDEML